jgi:hypothetical protein
MYACDRQNTTALDRLFLSRMQVADGIVGVAVPTLQLDAGSRVGYPILTTVLE